ncbi:MAG: DUF711 family protein [Thermoproteota archaeon]|nr:DUF711 family protein [Candidatus Bathyarchaeota archaeon]
MALIRALGYHIAPLNLEVGPEDLSKRLYGLASKIDNLCRGFDCEVWTRRIVLPQLPDVDPRRIMRYVDIAEQFAHDMKVDFIALPFSNFEFNKYGIKLVEILGENKKVVSSVKVAELGDVPTYAKITDAVSTLFEMAEVAGPEGCTRFALAYGDQPETAYFPDAASRRDGFSITLRYIPDLLEKVYPSSKIDDLVVTLLYIFKHFDTLAKRISKDFETQYLGIDTSLSPWMEESVARLVSKILDDEFGSPGTYEVLNRLNMALERASSEITALGFCEVMLSVAEDNILKDLCRAGKIQLKELVSMISICVSGLDMVAIPLSTPKKRLARLLMDTFAIACKKRKPIGVRLIPVPCEPNSNVEVGRFGKMPVLQV